MVFTSNLYKIVKIIRKTQAKFFRDLVIGDSIWFTLDLVAKKRHSTGVHSSYITTHLRNSDLYVKNTQGFFIRNISSFILVNVTTEDVYIEGLDNNFNNFKINKLIN